MALSCDIIFNKNPTKVYYTGQSLRGYVHLTLDREQDVCSVAIRISGIAIAKWQHGRAIRRCKQDCLSHQMNLIGLSKLTFFIALLFFLRFVYFFFSTTLQFNANNQRLFGTRWFIYSSIFSEKFLEFDKQI